MKAYGVRRSDSGCSWGCCLGKFGRRNKNTLDSRKLAKQRRAYKKLSHKAARARLKQFIIKEIINE